MKTVLYIKVQKSKLWSHSGPNPHLYVTSLTYEVKIVHILSIHMICEC